MKRLTDIRVWQIAAVALLVFAVFESFQSQAEVRHVTAARQRESQIVAHGGCLNLNNGRLRSRKFQADLLQIVFNAQVPGQIRTPQEQATINRVVADATARVGVVLPPINCDRAAPLPPNVTDAERAQLPVSEPIPPLHLNAAPAVPVTVPPSKGTP